jgi:hypothetical protein
MEFVIGVIRNSGIICCLWIFAALTVVAVQAEQRPSFVINFTDDQGYQNLGCFGSPDIRTPG